MVRKTIKNSDENKKAKSVKNSFLIFFDGIPNYVDSIVNCSTFSMGVCKLEYENETLTVHLRRPGLLIGKGGNTINQLSEYLECKVRIVEVDLLE